MRTAPNKPFSMLGHKSLQAGFNAVLVALTGCRKYEEMIWDSRENGRRKK